MFCLYWGKAILTSRKQDIFTANEFLQWSKRKWDASLFISFFLRGISSCFYIFLTFDPFRTNMPFSHPLKLLGNRFSDVLSEF